MSIISIIIFLFLLSFIFAICKRPAQVLYWNTVVFGFRETLNDAVSLVKLYLTIGTFINSLYRQHGATTLDFYRDGAGVLYEKNEEVISISVTRYAMDNNNDLNDALAKMCMMMVGDKHWLKLAKASPAAVITIQDGYDHATFSTTPIIIAFNQIKKHKPTHISGNTTKDNTHVLGGKRRTRDDHNFDSRHIHVADGTHRNIYQQWG